MLGRERKALPNGRYYPRPYDSQPRGRFAISEIEWARSLRKSGLGFSLLDLLLHCWERKATDPRDCIYGLSALASDIEAEELDLNIDYTATVAEVLTDAVNKILLKHGTLELFSNAGLGFPRPLPYLPSYVPNWSNLNVPAKPLYYLFDGGRQTLAPEEKGIRLHSCGQLQASAYFLDTVLMVSSGPLTGIQEAQYYEKCLAWLDEAERMSVYGKGQHCAKNPYPLMAPLEGYVSILEAFWRTLVADRSIRWSKAPPFGLHGYLRYKIRLSKACGKPSTTLFVNTSEYGRLYPVPTEDTAVLSEDWINTMRITSYGRSFCLTSAGRIGLVPPGTKPGDGICLLVGGAVPFVMRSYIPTNLPFIQQGVQLQLVGECYIHGVDAVETIKAWRSAAHCTAPHPVLLA